MRFRFPEPFVIRRLFRPGWVDIVPLLAEGKERLEGRIVDVWSLVLNSRGIPHRVNVSPNRDDDASLLVQPWFVQRAIDEIRLFITENPRDFSSTNILQARAAGNEYTTVLLILLLFLFDVIVNTALPSVGLFPHMWLQAGSASAADILAGQWWRVFTSLTLHGDGAHILGNAVLGGMLIIMLCRRMGTGLGWLLVILSGGLGNWVNALALGPPHNAIGFSTAVFGATGILSGFHPFSGRMVWMETLGFKVRLKRFLGSAFLPLAAGLGVLAMLGAGSGYIDLGAHFFGFCVGLMLGMVAGWLLSRHGRPKPGVDRRFLFLAVGMPVLSWVSAFSL